LCLGNTAMPLFGVLSGNYKSTEEEDADKWSVQSTVDTRAPTPPKLSPQQAHDQILGQLSETEWHLRQHQAAFADMRVEMATNMESLEGHLSQRLDTLGLKCDTDMAQLRRDLALQLCNFTQRLDALETKQEVRNRSEDDSVLQRVDFLAGRLALTNETIKKLGYAKTVEGEVAAEAHHVQCNPDLASLSTKVDLLESTLEAMKAHESENSANPKQNVNLDQEASLQVCLSRLQAFGERLDGMNAKVDSFRCTQATSNPVASESATKQQLLELGSRLEIVDSKLSMVLSYTDGIDTPHGSADDRNLSLRDNFVNPDTDQMTRDFAAKLCGVSERLERLEEQLSQNLQHFRDSPGVDAQNYLFQNMIDEFVTALTEDSQQLADLQRRYVEMRKQQQIYTDGGTITI